MLRPAAALALAGMLLAGSARGVDLQGLVQTSPFGSVNAAGPAANQPAAGLEFRGVFADKGEYFFSLYEASTHKGLWVALNEAGNPFTVRTYDAGTQTVTVDYQGRSLSLTLKRAKIIASAPVQVPPAAAPATAAAVPAQPTAAPIPDAAIAEEIRRRRAMRQQTAAPAPTPAPGDRPAPPQQP